MNALDKLKEKARQQGETLTVLERLILACPDPRLQLEGAAELYELVSGSRYSNRKDISELQSRQV